MTSTAFLHLDRLSHNLRLLQSLTNGRPLWPAIKANAYGHGAEIVARHLTRLGFHTLCVAHASEAAVLADAGIAATFVVLSAMLPDEAADIVAREFEPVVCTLGMVEALAGEATKSGKTVSVHLNIDTGMGRIGIRPDDVAAFLDRCRAFSALTVKGLMSHFPRADEADKTFSIEQVERFKRVVEVARKQNIPVCHMANSAAILDLPEAIFDAARPGIAIYGLAPSGEIANPSVRDLRPVLEWKTQITFLKSLPAGMGLSYGHAFHTERPSLIATIPVGYGDGLHRNLSGVFDVLVRGQRSRQVGRITMDQCLIDVTDLRGAVALGDEVVIIGRQGEEEVTADELASELGTINYEIVTSIAARVQREVV